MDLKEFGVYFAKLRMQSGYRSQRELAERSGVSHSTINRIESGKHKVTPENLKVLAPFLQNVEFSELMQAMGYIDSDSFLKIEEKKEISPLTGQRIKKLREEKAWSQLELAERAGINSDILLRIEAGKRPIEESEINIFADIFQVSADYILGRSVSRAPDAGRAFYGGGKDWTPEEMIAADAYIEMLRQKKLERQKLDNTDYM